MASWADFIKSVETVEPTDEIVTRVAAIFSEQLAAKVPLQAEGLAEDALNAKLANEPPMVAALARRTLRNVEVAAAARRTQASQGANVMVGAHAVQNARALASAIAPCKQADVADLLQKHHLQGLGFHLQADQCLFDSLTAHTEEAKKQGRVPFAFVDLTSKECLPLWVPSDAVGGRFAVRDEDEMALTGASPIANLGDLGRALKGATAVPRFFRSVQQWSAAFWRWAIAAVCAGHWKMTEAVAHHDVILQLAEQERVRSKPPYVAFLYDEMCRRQWARRAEKKDPNWNLAEETHKIDKGLLELVMQRLQPVLQQAGVEVPSSSRGSADAMAQLATAEAAQRRAEQATKALADAQKKLMDQSAAMTQDTKRKLEDPAKPWSTLTKKQQKTQGWYEKTQERIRQQKLRKTQH